MRDIKGTYTHTHKPEDDEQAGEFLLGNVFVLYLGSSLRILYLTLGRCLSASLSPFSRKQRTSL